MKKQKKNKIISIILGLIFLGGGAFLIGSSVLLNISQEKENEILLNEIKDKKNDDAKTEVGDGDKTYSIEDCILRIPSIDSENVISEGTDKEALSKSLGHEIGTALPGTEGNCVIAGHRNYTFGKYFNRLDEVKVGDEITAKIDENRRALIARNHSSVHLLQQALTEVLGNHIAQHGSYVNDEYSH